VPSRLLQNRPDIRQAERELAAAGLDVKVARARFFPVLAITVQNPGTISLPVTMLMMDDDFLSIFGNSHRQPGVPDEATRPARRSKPGTRRGGWTCLTKRTQW
jgi:hypothetical protein